MADEPQLDLEPSSSSEEEEEGGSVSIGKSVSAFDRERHVTFLRMMYQMIPYHYQSHEINRITLAYFAISGLDIVGALDTVDRDEVACWVLSLRAQPRDVAGIDNGEFYGFSGSRSSQFPSENSGGFSVNHSHLASTYCALAILKIIRHNLFDIDWRPLLMSMRNLQQPDGSFLPIHFGAETDLRFTYCAGGGTFCAVASLRLMGFLEDDLLSSSGTSSILDVQLLLDWQAFDGGFQGRLNKPSDTCYAFWVGAVLKMLGGQKLINDSYSPANPSAVGSPNSKMSCPISTIPTTDSLPSASWKNLASTQCSSSSE